MDWGVGRPKTNVGSRNKTPTGQSDDIPLFLPHNQERPLEKTLIKTVTVRALFGRLCYFSPDRGALQQFWRNEKVGNSRFSFTWPQKRQQRESVDAQTQTSKCHGYRPRLSTCA
jgi:hypothetical protein